MSVPIEQMSDYARSMVRKLDLEAHPEGGWYTRDWQSPQIDGSSGRPLSSLIYFLLPEGDASAWHKVDADEIWLWHGPAPVTLQLGGTGDSPATGDSVESIVLGESLAHGDTGETSIGHAVVHAGVWQRTIPGKGDALVSCVVSPGFVFEGFKLE